MKRFFVLYMASEGDFKKAMSGMADVTLEQRKAGMEEWKEWMQSKGGVVDMGAPLGKTKRVTQSEISDMRNEIGGYSIIEAESHEEASEKMKDSPHFKMMPGGWIEVMEIMPM
ncbi:MAG TPA: YciI family protein [Candidatus Paceibacterota bacterium]|nr:YciI family protein [Candidatus Paceibacterota bacterium]